MSQNTRAQKYPVLFSLTGLTGAEAHTDRTVAWAGFEINRRWWYILLAGFFPAGMVMLSVWPLLGSLSVLVFFLFEGGLLYLIVYRSSKGLHLRAYETIYDKHRSVDGQFILCGRPIQIENMSPGWIYCSSQLTHNTPPDIQADEDDDDASDIFSAMAGLDSQHQQPPRRKRRPAGEIRGVRSNPEDYPLQEPLSIDELLDA